MLEKFKFDTSAKVRAIAQNTRATAYLQVKGTTKREDELNDVAVDHSVHNHTIDSIYASKGLPNNNIEIDCDSSWSTHAKSSASKKKDKPFKKADVSFLVHYKKLAHYHDEWVPWLALEKLYGTLSHRHLVHSGRWI